MGIQIILISFSILILAWALKRMLAKIQSMERHIKGMRSRVNLLERRLTSTTKKFTPEYKPSKPRQQTRSVTKNIGATEHTTKPMKTSRAVKPEKPKVVVCPFCGTKFPADADRCPNCNHINIEKYRVKRKSQSSPDDDIDI